MHAVEGAKCLESEGLLTKSSSATDCLTLPVPEARLQFLHLQKGDDLTTLVKIK